MRFIGLVVHRDFCEVAVSEGGKARRVGRVAASPAGLELFAQSLVADDRVVLEATGNALAMRPRACCGGSSPAAGSSSWESTRTKNEISTVLLRTLQGRPPVSNVFGKAGRVAAGARLG